MERLAAEGRTFEVVVASDVVRDGLGVELHELLPGDQREVVMEVFRFDDPDAPDVVPIRTAVTHCSREVPFDVAKQLMVAAERELMVRTPPSSTDE